MVFPQIYELIYKAIKNPAVVLSLILWDIFDGRQQTMLTQVKE